MTKIELKDIILSNQNAYCQEKIFKKNFPEVYNIICSITFPNDFKFKQKLYHYIEDDINLSLGKCVVCGNRCRFVSFKEGYKLHCTRKCIQQDNIVKNKVLNTWMNKSDDDIKQFSKHQSESMLNVMKNRSDEEKKSIRKKGADTFKMKNKNDKDVIKLKKQNTWKSHTEKEKIEYSRKVSINSSNMWKGFSQEKKEKVCKNISIATLNSTAHKNIWYNLSDEQKKLKIEKDIQTKRKNNTFNTSKIEDDVADWLKNNQIDFYRQYNLDNRYPFLCDFYLPKYDLFIEIQGNWTHGKHPFNPDNIKDKELLEFMKSKKSKYYERSVYVWSIRDVKKRTIAKENNINYLEIFSIDLQICVDMILDKLKKLS